MEGMTHHLGMKHVDNNEVILKISHADEKSLRKWIGDTRSSL
jgi:hypothetical protein